MSVLMTVHNCSTQYSTEQFWQSSLVSYWQSSMLRNCLLESRKNSLQYTDNQIINRL